MTKSKKILTLVVAALLIAAAIFFAVWTPLTSKFVFEDEDFSGYVTLDPSKYLNLSVTVDDTAIAYPTTEDQLAKLAAALASYVVKEKDSNGKDVEVQYREDPISYYDIVFLNYLAYYMDGENKVYVTPGSAMDPDSQVEYQINAGSTYDSVTSAADKEIYGAINPFRAQLDAALMGAKPSDYTYTEALKGLDEEKLLIKAGDVVYINYSWERFPYVDEDNDGVPDRGEDGEYLIKDGKDDKETSSSDKTLVTENFRLDLSNVPSYFPTGFADKMIGLEDGTKAKELVFDEVAGTDKEGNTVLYHYEYSVTVNWIVGSFTGLSFAYTYAEDATEKDIYGNELKGKTVTIEVVPKYFYDVPSFYAEFDTDEKDESGNTIKESILTHDDYLNFDKSEYYTEKEIKDEDAWLEENADKTHDDYITYLKEQYEAYAFDQLVEAYDEDRMIAAAQLIWEELLEFTKAEGCITLPTRALRITYEELKDNYEQTYYEGSTTENSKTVYYRDVYSTFDKFMKNQFAKEMEAGNKTWKDCLYSMAGEYVHERVLIHYLFDELELEYTDEDYTEALNNNFYYAYLYGVSSEVIVDAVVFDKVIEHLFENAKENGNIAWESEAPSAE